ncbi:MAG TPA: MarR family transcriptional regulator [Gammaproteobacteria bacterium]|nr:MarR family transcriptional regulator [Gammaproteobacteria bacterium]
MATALATGQFDEAILTSLRRIMRAVDLYSRQLASRHRLTGPQLVCLRLLHRNGMMTSGHLAREATLSAGTVTGILDRLEQRGYVRRERATADKRQVTVALTEPGREAVAQAPLPLQERFQQRLAALPATHQQEILHVLDKIVSMMEAEELDAAPLLASGTATAESEQVAAFLGDHPAPPKP